jgi:hypothetical protein
MFTKSCRAQRRTHPPTTPPHTRAHTQPTSLQVIAISARPDSRWHGVVLEAVPAKGKSTQLWSPKPAGGLPREFVDAAERVRQLFLKSLCV